MQEVKTLSEGAESKTFDADTMREVVSLKGKAPMVRGQVTISNGQRHC
jgi:uncharacterized protein (UPF0335 family)